MTVFVDVSWFAISISSERLFEGQTVILICLIYIYIYILSQNFNINNDTKINKATTKMNVKIFHLVY